MSIGKKVVNGAVLMSVALLFIGARVLNAQSTAPTAPNKTTATKKKVPQQTKPVLEPKALAILKAASDRLAAADSMSFTSTVTYESPSHVGVPLAYTTKSDVILERPDKLRVISLGDGPPFEFYYDGKHMMAYEPAEDLVAIADAPPTIDETMGVAYHIAAIYLPFDDMIVAYLYQDFSQDLRMACTIAS